MPYVYPDVDGLQNKPKVGSKQCVALVQHYAKLPSTPFWKEGKSVMDGGSIVKGTAIANFVNGKYQSLSHGNHAAFLISRDANGIWVMDQWSDDKKKPLISKRYISRRGKASDGTFYNPSDNADAYSVIE